jgi:integrase
LNKRYIQAEKSKFICFFEESANALDEKGLSSMFIKLKKKINAEHKGKILSDNFSFHSLRLKFIITLINSGQPIKKISTIVGHASIAMTERMCYHYTDEEKLVTISNLSFGRSIENTLK